GQRHTEGHAQQKMRHQEGDGENAEQKQAFVGHAGDPAAQAGQLGGHGAGHQNAIGRVSQGALQGPATPRWQGAARQSARSWSPVPAIAASEWRDSPVVRTWRTAPKSRDGTSRARVAGSRPSYARLRLGGAVFPLPAAPGTFPIARAWRRALLATP